MSTSDFKPGLFLARLWLAVVLLVAIFGPEIFPASTETNLEILQPPSALHLLGTDEDGRDIVTMLIAGARTAALVGILTVLFSGVLGTFLGTLSGYLGGAVDRIVLTATEAVYAFPGILLAIFLMFLVPRPGVTHIIAALCVSGWATYARLTRGIAMSTKERPFIEATRALGFPLTRILSRHIIPQTLPHVAIQAAFGIANAILAEAALSFLGLGIADGTSWGAMLSAGAVLYLKAPALALAPGAVLALTVLTVLTLADHLQQRLNPKGSALFNR